MRRVALGVLVVLALAFAAGAEESPRYAAIRALIKKNLHLSGHLVRAVDARTIAEVRKRVTEADIPVLIRMLGDQETVVGIGASDVLATLGDNALPALTEASRSRDDRISSNATDALRRIADCRENTINMNPDVCPAPGRGVGK